MNQGKNFRGRVFTEDAALDLRLKTPQGTFSNRGLRETTVPVVLFFVHLQYGHPLSFLLSMGTRERAGLARAPSWQGLRAQGPALPWWVRPLCRGGGLLAKAGAWDEMSSSLGPGPAGVAFTTPVPVPDYRKLTSPCP